jgi:hypothetical protein
MLDHYIFAGTHCACLWPRREFVCESFFPARQAITLEARRRRECRSWAALERSAVSTLRNLAYARELRPIGLLAHPSRCQHARRDLSFWRSHGITFVTIQSLQTHSITIALGFGRGSISIFYHGLIHFRRGSPDFNQG